MEFSCEKHVKKCLLQLWLCQDLRVRPWCNIVWWAIFLFWRCIFPVRLLKSPISVSVSTSPPNFAWRQCAVTNSIIKHCRHCMIPNHCRQHVTFHKILSKITLLTSLKGHNCWQLAKFLHYHPKALLPYINAYVQFQENLYTDKWAMRPMMAL